MVGIEHQQGAKSSGANKGQIHQHFLALVVWHDAVFRFCLPFFSLTVSFSLVEFEVGKWKLTGWS